MCLRKWCKISAIAGRYSSEYGNRQRGIFILAVFNASSGINLFDVSDRTTYWPTAKKSSKVTFK